MDNSCYNPYQGVKNIKDLRAKSIRETRANKAKHSRMISIYPQHILEDARTAIKEVLSPGFDITTASTESIKGIGFLCVVVCLLGYLFTFLAQ